MPGIHAPSLGRTSPAASSPSAVSLPFPSISHVANIGNWHPPQAQLYRTPRSSPPDCRLAAKLPNCSWRGSVLIIANTLMHDGPIHAFILSATSSLRAARSGLLRLEGLSINSSSHSQAHGESLLCQKVLPTNSSIARSQAERKRNTHQICPLPHKRQNLIYKICNYSQFNQLEHSKI